MRTFIAIGLPVEIKDKLARLQEELRSGGADVKWVEPENIHLTLKFLGEVAEDKLDKVRQIMASVAAEFTVFQIKIDSVGAFPRIESPRVIWAGTGEEDKEAKSIAKELDEKLNKIGFSREERAFSSHMTLGRSRSGLNQRALAEKIKNLKDYFKDSAANFRVTKITLYKSTLAPKGPIYEALTEANLRTA